MFKELEESPYDWDTVNKREIAETSLRRHRQKCFLFVLEALNLGVDVYMTQPYLHYENFLRLVCEKGSQSISTETRWNILIMRNGGPWTNKIVVEMTE